MVLKVGFSKVDITPPVDSGLSIPILGFWWERAKAYQDIHDPLYARVAYFQNDDQFIVVSMDSIGDGIGFTDSIRQLTSKRMGIPREKIMISCTHTHTAPETYDLCWHPVDKKWLEEMTKRVAAAIEGAHRKMECATVHCETALTEGLVKNRRADYVRKKVTELMPDELARSIDLDERLYVMAFLGSDRLPIGLLVNFACHPVIMQTAPTISADYTGFVAEEVEKRIDAPALYLNGPCGDVNPACGDTRNYGDVVALGTRLSSHIQGIVESIRTKPSDKESNHLLARQTAIGVQRRDLPQKEILLGEKERYEREVKARSVVPPAYEDALGAALFSVREALTLYEKPEHYEAEVQVFSLGPYAIVGIPGEFFTCLGRDIRKESKNTILIATLANRMLGYIAPHEAFTVGGYETESLARWSRLAPGSGETIRNAAIQMLRSCL